MSILDESEKKAQKRDVLVRIKPLTDVTDDLILDAGLDYYIIFDVAIPVSVLENGSSKSFTYNSSTKRLDVTLADAPSSTNPVMVFWYLYITNSEAKYLDGDDPTGTISSVAEWLPRLSTPPVVSSKIGDIINSRISVTSSKISLNNSDRFYDDLFKRDGDGEINKNNIVNMETAVWFGFNNVYDLVFFGIVTKFSFSDTSFNLVLKDNLRKLSVKTLFNMPDSWNYARKQTRTLMDPTMDNTPIPYIFGTASVESGFDDNGNYFIPTPKIDKLPRAIMIDIDSENPNSTNRNKRFLLGRTLEPLSSRGLTLSFTKGTTTDTVTISGSSGNATYRVINLGDNIYDVTAGCFLTVGFSGYTPSTPSNTITFIDYSNGDIYFRSEFGANSFNVNSVKRSEPITVYSKHDETLVPLNTLFVSSYSEFPSPTSGGGYLHSMTFNSSVILDPKGVYYFALHSKTAPHYTKPLKHLLKKAGYINASFTSVETASYPPEYFTIPSLGQTDFGTYEEYVSNILGPKLNAVKQSLDDSLDIELLDIESTIDESNEPAIIHEIYENDIIDGSLIAKYDYQDVSSKLTLSNPLSESLSLQNLSNIEYSSDQIRQKYNIDKETSIEHTGLAFNDTTKGDEQWQIVSSPKNSYSMKLTLKWFFLVATDYIRVHSSKLPSSYKDGSEWVLLWVTDVSKSINGVRVEARQIPYI